MVRFLKRTITPTNFKYYQMEYDFTNFLDAKNEQTQRNWFQIHQINYLIWMYSKFA